MFFDAHGNTKQTLPKQKQAPKVETLPGLRRLLFFKLFRQVDQIESVGRTCKGRVEPAIKIFAQHLLGDVADIQENVHPLSALCLVAGDGIGKLDLQDVVVRVGLHLFHLARLCRYVVVIFKDGVKQFIVHLFR